MTQKNDKKKKRLTKKQKQYLEFLFKFKGIISKATDAMRIGRKSHYNWLENSEFSEAVENVQQSLKDFGENALIKLIKNGNPAAVIFFNKSKNKDRGYAERQEIEHSGNIEGNTKLILEIIDAKDDIQPSDEGSEKE